MIGSVKFCEGLYVLTILYDFKKSVNCEFCK